MRYLIALALVLIVACNPPTEPDPADDNGVTFLDPDTTFLP